MKAFLALMRREFIEHRVSFLYAPLVILGLVALLLVSGMLTGHVETELYGVLPASPKFYEIVYGLALGAWWIYLVAALAFYCADAFSADRRNSSLLFWKSMPQGDTKILWSKMAAALTLFPALTLLSMLLSGLVALGLAVWASHGGLTAGVLVGRFLDLSAVGFVYLLISLAWYAPFYAWVGALATAFGRWSIPLALLIPGLLALVEAIYAHSSVILDYLRARANLTFAGVDISHLLLFTPRVEADRMVPLLLETTNWRAIVTGLAFMVVAVTLAGQYRRRTLK